MPKQNAWLSRKEWIDACEFLSTQEAEVLEQITLKIKQCSDLGRKPYVLLDLDSTLYEVAPRTARILNEAAQSLGPSLPQNVRECLDGVGHPKVGYSIEDTWKNLGLCLQNPELAQARDRLRKFWEDRFFSNPYLNLDEPYPGTADFVNHLYSLGAELVYLTGRDRPGMEEGTLRNLVRDGFPIKLERTQLRMKAERQGDDIEHKVGVALQLQQTGTVVASFENEPKNFVALFQAVPEAVHVFVDTVCSDHPAPIIRGGAFRFRRFRA